MRQRNGSQLLPERDYRPAYPKINVCLCVYHGYVQQRMFVCFSFERNRLRRNGLGVRLKLTVSSNEPDGGIFLNDLGYRNTSDRINWMVILSDSLMT